VSDADAEWYDIWAACEQSGLVTWQDWIIKGLPELQLFLISCLHDL
jgi:hypothetical protein